MHTRNFATFNIVSTELLFMTVVRCFLGSRALTTPGRYLLLNWPCSGLFRIQHVFPVFVCLLAQNGQVFVLSVFALEFVRTKWTSSIICFCFRPWKQWEKPEKKFRCRVVFNTGLYASIHGLNSSWPQNDTIYRIVGFLKIDERNIQLRVICKVSFYGSVQGEPCFCVS